MDILRLIVGGLGGKTPWLHYAILLLTGLLVPVCLYMITALRQRLVRIETKIDEHGKSSIENSVHVTHLTARVSRVECWINGRLEARCEEDEN